MNTRQIKKEQKKAQCNPNSFGKGIFELETSLTHKESKFGATKESRKYRKMITASQFFGKKYKMYV